MLLIHPNSFAAKEEIKAVGGRWNPKEKGWDMRDQVAFDVAFDACENATKERPGARFWGNEEDEDYSWLTTAPAEPEASPIGGQEVSAVKSGLVFTKKERGSNASSEWVVLCTFAEENTPAMADKGDFLCGCLCDRQWSYMSPAKISSQPWTGEVMPMSDAKELYDRFLEVQ